MNRLILRLVLAFCMMSFAACSAKISQQVSYGLWAAWEDYDQQEQQDYPDAVPIILVHGWNGGEFSWPGPRSLMSIEKKLQRDIYFFNYRTGIVANRYPPIELLEEQLDLYLANYKQVDIVAHSMGGLLVRQYLSEHGDNPVRRILFLSTPNFGTSVASLLVDIGAIGFSGNIQATELLPGSDFLWQLNSLEGIELEGKSVLNVYAREQNQLFKGDLIVRASHAWLPWAANAEVDGDHHLGRRITEPWALDFLRSGQLPQRANAPPEKELWLRFEPAGATQPLSLKDTSVRRYDAAAGYKEKKFSLCCDERSGLHPLGGTTMIINDVKTSDMVELFLRNGTESRKIQLKTLISKDWPIQMHIVYPN